MAGFLSLKLKGHTKFIKDVKEITKNIKNKKPAFLAAAIVYQAWILRNFQAEGKLHDKQSLHWKQLKSQRSRQGKKKRRDKILWDTGQLAQSWEVTANQTRGRVKSKKEYSSAHEHGVRKRNLSQRKIFPEDAQAWKIVKPAFVAWMKKATK